MNPNCPICGKQLEQKKFSTPTKMMIVEGKPTAKLGETNKHYSCTKCKSHWKKGAATLSRHTRQVGVKPK